MQDVFKVSIDWKIPAFSITTTWCTLALVLLSLAALWLLYRSQYLRNPLSLDKIIIDIPLPGGKIIGELKPDEGQRKAAWELYVELITRVSVVDLLPNEGLLREALSSLYSLFGTTRQVLRQHGVSVSRPRAKNSITVGYVAVSVLNGGLRPFLAKWHPLLQEYEAERNPSVSPMAHEEMWPHNTQLRQELDALRKGMMEYAKVLEEIAGVPSTLIVKNGNN